MKSTERFFTAWRDGDWSWRVFYVGVLVAEALGIAGLTGLLCYIAHNLAGWW